MEVEMIECPNDERSRRGELEDHESRSRGKHAMYFAERDVEGRNVANPERDGRSVHRPVTQRKKLRIRAHRTDSVARSLPRSRLQHRHREIRSDDESAKTRVPDQLG